MSNIIYMKHMII